MNEPVRFKDTSTDFYLSLKKFEADKAHGEYVEKFLIELLSNNKG